MLLMLLLGWAVVLPAAVVAGLLLASTVLGQRARRAGFVDVTGLARELSRLPGATRAATRGPRHLASVPLPAGARTTERHPVGV